MVNGAIALQKIMIRFLLMMFQKKSFLYASCIVEFALRESGCKVVASRIELCVSAECIGFRFIPFSRKKRQKNEFFIMT